MFLHYPQGNNREDTMAKRYLVVPNKANLEVTGTCLSPPTSRSSSPDSNFSEHGSQSSQDYTVLDGVKEMNEMLLMQIEALRRKMQESEKSYNEEKAALLESKNCEIGKKNDEIINLKTVLTDKDKSIHWLRKDGARKDKVIRDKNTEVENLKKITEEIKQKADKIQRKVQRAQKRAQMSDSPPGGPTDELTAKLKTETEQLKTRFAVLEEELAKAMKMIEQQAEQIKALSENKSVLDAELSEKFDQLSESVRREVQRTCQVILQNNEETKELKKENYNLRQELHDINNNLQIMVQRNYTKEPENVATVAINSAYKKLLDNEFDDEEQQHTADPKSTIPHLQREKSQLFIRSNRIHPEQPSSNKNGRLTKSMSNFPEAETNTGPRGDSEMFNDEDVGVVKLPDVIRKPLVGMIPQGQGQSVNRSTQNESTQLLPRYPNQQARSLSGLSRADHVMQSVRQSDDNQTKRLNKIQASKAPGGVSIQTLVSPAGENIKRKDIIPPILQKTKQGKPAVSARGAQFTTTVVKK